MGFGVRNWGMEKSMMRIIFLAKIYGWMEGAHIHTYSCF